MRLLTEDEFVKEAQVSLRHIFANNNAYGEVFASGANSRIILFEYWYKLEGLLLEAIIRAASDEGDTGFYLTILNRPLAERQIRPYHWYIPFNEINEYQRLVEPLPNVIYSPSGCWGILGSDEHHGLLGGKNRILDKVRQKIPDIDLQVFKFLDNWVYNKAKYHSKIDWLEKLLINTYGKEAAEKISLEFNLDF